jgi:hypothetical protein
MRIRLLTLLAALALVLVAGTSPAAAHGDEGELTLTKVEQTGPTTVSIEVGIVYEGDGHLAEDAQVSATLTGPDGATVGPVDLTRSGDTTSLYQAAVEVPTQGDWAVAVTSTEPAGEVSGSVTVAAQTDTAAGDPSTTVAAVPIAGAPEPVTVTDDVAGEEDAAEDSGPSPALIVGACLVLAALVIGGAFLVARSRNDDAPDTTSDQSTGDA